jgi:hypothetical protein
MNMKSIYIVVLLLISTSLIAQDSYLLNYEWEKSPTPHNLSETEKDLSELFILHRLGNEIFYADGNAIEYYMEHVIKRINTEDAIDGSNKVYMPGSLADKSRYTVIEKARVIKSNGTILALDAEDILEEVNEEEGKTYRYYALKNVEVGDEIEYFYVYPSGLRTNGVIYRIQTDVFKREVEVINITPHNLINDFKSFNGFPEMLKEEEFEDYNRYSAIMENVPELKEEKYADYNAGRAAVAYYLKENTATSYTADYYTSVSKYVAESLSSVDPKKDGTKKLLAKIKVDRSADVETQIRTVENYVKREIKYMSKGLDDLGVVKTAISKRRANEIGLIKIFGNIFDQLEIPYEVVYSCDRGDLLFDKEFECGIYIDESMFYFPKEKKYLSPTSASSRYGYPPNQYAGNYGYFTRFIQLGDLRSGLGKTKYITPASSQASVDNFVLTLNLDKLPESSSTIERQITGYNALTYQFILDLVDPENKVEIQESLINYIDADMDITNMEVTNTSIEDFGIRPLTITGEFSSKTFVQKAGNKYLINVGKMIGPQAEMYQEEKRKLPVSNQFNKQYERKLIINIPVGYMVDNLDSLIMNIVYDKDGEKDMGFISTYELEKNQLIVMCKEYYNRVNYTVDEYSKFEKVINAAADFNKVAIVLKKK